MADYIKTLEKRNDELQEQLTKTSIWLPVWTEVMTNISHIYYYKSGYCEVARVEVYQEANISKPVYRVHIVDYKGIPHPIRCSTIEEAKQVAEQGVTTRQLS